MLFSSNFSKLATVLTFVFFWIFLSIIFEVPLIIGLQLQHIHCILLLNVNAFRLVFLDSLRNFKYCVMISVMFLGNVEIKILKTFASQKGMETFVKKKKTYRFSINLQWCHTKLLCANKHWKLRNISKVFLYPSFIDTRTNMYCCCNWWRNSKTSKTVECSCNWNKSYAEITSLANAQGTGLLIALVISLMEEEL